MDWKNLENKIKNNTGIIWWIIGIVLLIKMIKPDLTFRLGTQSIFGVFGTIGISIGLIIVLGGLLLGAAGFPALGFIGIFSGILLSGGSFFSILSDLFSGKFGIFAIIIAVVFGLYFITRLFKK